MRSTALFTISSSSGIFNSRSVQARGGAAVEQLSYSSQKSLSATFKPIPDTDSTGDHAAQAAYDKHDPGWYAKR